MAARFTTLLDPALLGRVDTARRRRARRRWNDRRALAGQVLELSAQVIKPGAPPAAHAGPVPSLTRAMAAATSAARRAGDEWHALVPEAAATAIDAAGALGGAGDGGGTTDPDSMVAVTFLPARGRLAALRAVATHLLPRSVQSHRSLWSSHSLYSVLSVSSVASWGSVLSAFSAGSILSIGSAGSILSIGSAGSVLSIGSAGSVCGIGAHGATLPAGAGDPTPATRLVQQVATTAAAVAVAAVAVGA